MIASADIGVASDEHTCCSQSACLKFAQGLPRISAREQAFVGHLLGRLSTLRLNARNLTLRAATKCLLSLRIHFGTRFALFTASSPIALRWSSGTDRRVRVWSPPTVCCGSDLALGC